LPKLARTHCAAACACSRDEASLDLLLHLARSAHTQGLLVLLTLRTEDAGPSAIDLRMTLERHRLMTELALAPLGAEGVAAMVGCLLGDAPPAQVTETILGLTEGNPFFVEEVERTTLAAGRARVEHGAVGVPRTVHDAVQRRVHRLGERARQVLQVAAIAGRRFDFELLQRVLGISERELLPILKELITRTVLARGPGRLVTVRKLASVRSACTRRARLSHTLGGPSRPPRNWVVQFVRRRQRALCVRTSYRVVAGTGTRTWVAGLGPVCGGATGADIHARTRFCAGVRGSRGRAPRGHTDGQRS
jgi:hypothetical protein